MRISRTTGKKMAGPNIMELSDITRTDSRKTTTKDAERTRVVLEWCPRGRPSDRWEIGIRKIAGVNWRDTAQDRHTQKTTEYEYTYMYTYVYII